MYSLAYDANLNITQMLAAIMMPVTPFSARGLAIQRTCMRAQKNTPTIMPKISQRESFMYQWMSGYSSYLLVVFAVQRARRMKQRKVIGLSMDIIKGINYNHQMLQINTSKTVLQYIANGKLTKISQNHPCTLCLYLKTRPRDSSSLRNYRHCCCGDGRGTMDH